MPWHASLLATVAEEQRQAMDSLSQRGSQHRLDKAVRVKVSPLRFLIAFAAACLVFQGVSFVAFHSSMRKADTQQASAPTASAFVNHKADSARDLTDAGPLEQAVLYVNSFHSLDRRLTFFHVPKTAGTAIENAAGEHHINWGSCMFKHKPRRPICNYPGDHDWPINVGYWHLPVQFFPLAQTDPYQAAELFGVIRHPYDRMVSEFYYICTLKVKDWRPDQCDRTRLSESGYMNEWLSQKLKRRKQGSDKSTANEYLLDNGHFTPQYEYVVGPHQVRMLDHVLRLDGDLNNDFQALMQAYNLQSVQLRKINAIGAESREQTAALDIHDLHQSTMDLIYESYPHDFSEFSYSREMPVKEGMQQNETAQA
jgi:Sulfotransferase family